MSRREGRGIKYGKRLRDTEGKREREGWEEREEREGWRWRDRRERVKKRERGEGNREGG